jgi:hypothetical protein
MPAAISAPRTSSLSQKARTIEYNDTKIPSCPPDIITQFRNASGLKTDHSNRFVIDVFPNMTPIFCYILFNVSNTYRRLEPSDHAKLSQSTYAMYCFAILYGYILGCDLVHRDSISPAACEYERDPIRRRFIDYLMDLPVPDFMSTLLLRLAPTTDERKPNVQFCPSAQGVSLHTHFGKIYPLLFFAQIHETICDTSSSKSKNFIRQSLFSRSILNVTTFSATRHHTKFGIHHFLGYLYTLNTSTDNYGSKLNQVFDSLFNPSLFRDYQKRATLANLSLQTPTYATANINPYDLLFSISNQTALRTISEYQTVFDAISPLVQGNVPCSKNLASHLTSVSGSNILSHGYSAPALPTYCAPPGTSKSNDPSTDLPVDPNPLAHGYPDHLITTDTFASSINFLQKPTDTTLPVNRILNQPEGTCRTDGTHPVRLTNVSWPWNMLHNDDATSNSPDYDTDYIQYNDLEFLYPPVRVMIPHTNDPVDAPLVTLFGMIIESLELDGTTVPVPDPSLVLGIENSFFFDSAVPYNLTIYATSFYARASHLKLFARRRAQPLRQTREPASHLMIDRTTINVSRPAATTSTIVSIDQWFSGLTILQHVTTGLYQQSFFGFKSADTRDHAANDDQPSGMPHGRLYVWSPYTYTSFTESDANNTNDPSSTRSYFLTNMRTFFGTGPQLIEVNHPYQAMPVA